MKSTLFLSDTHLGNRKSQTNKLLKFLKENTRHQRLVLVGDTFDDHYELPFCTGWMQIMYNFLSFDDILIVPGNHDKWLKKFINYQFPFVTNVNITVAQESILLIGHKKFLITHGDAYDWSMVFAISSRTLRGLSTDWQFLHKYFTGHKSLFVRRCVKRAKDLGCDGVICGHSHQPSIQKVDGIIYLNTGDWFTSCTAIIEQDGTFQLVDHNGNVLASIA